MIDSRSMSKDRYMCELLRQEMMEEKRWLVLDRG